MAPPAPGWGHPVLEHPELEHPVLEHPVLGTPCAGDTPCCVPPGCTRAWLLLWVPAGPSSVG